MVKVHKHTNKWYQKWGKGKKQISRAAQFRFESENVDLSVLVTLSGPNPLSLWLPSADRNQLKGATPPVPFPMEWFKGVCLTSTSRGSTSPLPLQACPIALHGGKYLSSLSARLPPSCVVIPEPFTAMSCYGFHRNVPKQTKAATPDAWTNPIPKKTGHCVKCS